ncbi:MAG: GTPase HflX [Solirubrobacterales bacterium]|nr:GTPase HflX [Solirubrobacterales bacterium]
MNPVPPVRKILISGASLVHPYHVDRRPPARSRGPDPPESARTLERVQAGDATTQETSSNGAVAGVRNRRARQRALAIGASPRPTGDRDPLGELKELLRTAGVATAGEVVQVRSEPDPDRYLGRGKLAEVQAEVARADANLIACDDELAPRQERNLEAALDVPVIDRTAIILDIFADHAHSAEGKLQVELAQLEYNLARMRGLWTHLERLGAGRIDGGIGTRGPGESQIETDRRLARDRITTLRRRLDRLSRNRDVMRARREASTVPTVALAGYTNAGKSTLLNALTGAGVAVGERLFHTLDPTTRAYEHNGRRYLATDTVGFIHKLPHQLVDAFKATLEETRLADLIVHVVDGSDPAPERAEAIAAVDSVLDEIGAGDRPRLLAFNKIDLLDTDARRDLLVGEPGTVGVSATTGEGLAELRDRIESTFEETLREVELLVPYADGGRLSELHELAGDLERVERADGVLVRARIPAALRHRFADLELDGAAPASE